MTTTNYQTASVGFADQIPPRLFIGEWREGRSERELVTRDPFDDRPIATIRQASVDDVDEAYASAAAAQPQWAAATPRERTAVLKRAGEYIDAHRDDIATLISAESGSSALKAAVEVGLVLDSVQEAATFPSRVHGRISPSNTPGKENRVYREPLGVVGVISPWNFPFILSARSVAPALALGNAVVLKPASDTPLSGGLLLAKIFEEAGLPAGVLNVVIGSGAEIGDHFVEHRTPSLISFTGSTSVGQNVGRVAIGGNYMKRVALELGGNAPFVVLADADVDLAVRAAAMAKFLHQGQICMSVNRIIVEAPVYDEFVEKFVEHVATISYGNVADPSTIIGPIINDQQLDSIVGKIDRARHEGARQVHAGPIEGRVVAPHVFADVTAEMELFTEEIFGPVVGLVRAENQEHALELANDTNYGLSSAVFTRNIERGVTFARGIKAGMTHINDITVNDEAHVMFGGEKNSGLGRFNGDWAIEEFTTDHWIGVQSAPVNAFPF
ncbi:aldehyde dehydrogenase family protein [Arthrobacter sulfonylureivorans]|uniref:Aldehyde dehydrogenase family protein n=1 Tax=Arthrobacter sulfonylureivorans TaxID=2486855 RepID=A0ABY3WEW2_9MICC|nr:aldehyde dehydrogenase family protein [Arthrobacter sulfonylureivorans]UNK47765.1 aldehyde dehydrogenase family protein [Arthrobacter sulfonylureivorans]